MANAILEIYLPTVLELAVFRLPKVLFTLLAYVRLQ